ncbi:alpha/beta fold hydrolase [Nocardiopsis sediminis]|uniref:Alpha/beta fold hydrolase n=1 Tax=Nocardiopsis sediminis TaxID=1778267 RepID=A0ABV8FGC4_9ACTN
MARSTASTGIYRSATGRAATRSWCRSELATWPVLRAHPPLTTRLGPTAAFHAPGGPGTPVLVLAGTNFNAATGVALARELAVDRPVHLADLPGQPGLSADERPRRDQAAAYGAWLDDVLPQITDRPVILLGHSRGAAVALAATPSHLVAGLLLVNPAGLASAAFGPAAIRATLPWLLAPSPATGARLLDFMSGPGHQGGHGTTAEWIALVGEHARTSLAPGPLTPDVVRAWRDTPVTVATGSHDPFFPPGRIAGPAGKLLGCTVQTVAGTGHLTPHERSDLVRDLLRDLPTRPV